MSFTYNEEISDDFNEKEEEEIVEKSLEPEDEPLTDLISQASRETTAAETLQHAEPTDVPIEVFLATLERAPKDPEPLQTEKPGNLAYANAMNAYQEKEYQQAIEQFSEALEYEKQHTQDDQVCAKALYWQAEAYVKLQDIPQAIATFEDLIKNCQGHYLVLAAQRRAERLNAKHP